MTTRGDARQGPGFNTVVVGGWPLLGRSGNPRRCCPWQAPPC
ncbi:hypothetical protein QJS66_10980 [Kocuria rhizophila]|nr:hypothetical protein QJS66_10980 [Kocuria rhizophila]